MNRGPKRFTRQNPLHGVPITPHQAQLEPGEIYLCGHTFRYVYTLESELVLCFESVCYFFGLFPLKEQLMVEPKHMRRIYYHVSKPIQVHRFFIVKDGVRWLGNRAWQNQKLKKDVLKLYSTYEGDTLK